MSDRDREPIVVLGAGLAGLSFVDAMLDRRPDARILVVDRRRRWGSDRTWCTWLTGPLRFSELSRHRWASWRITRRGTDVIKRARRSPYIHLGSRDVYERVLDRIALAPNVELHPGVGVERLRRHGDRWLVASDLGELEAATVIDAMGVHGPLVASPPRRPVLEQSFLGWEIEADGPVFDPAVATLMDFRGVSHGGMTFFYVLPFSAQRALIEHTTIGAPGRSLSARAVELGAEADRMCGARGWRVVRREQGRIPMTEHAYALSRGSGCHVVGSAAGAIRPSSGYAFSRTQRHVERLVDAIQAQTDPPTVMTHPRYGLLDRLFLTAIRSASDAGESLFWDAARSIDADRFARFMTDSSSPRDDLRVVSALPSLPAAIATGVLRSSLG